MRVWSQLSSPNRQYFKPFTIQQPVIILSYLNYLTTSQQVFDTPQKTTPLSQKTNLKNQILQLSSNSNQSKSAHQIIELTTEDGKIQKFSIRNILPIANLQLFLKNKQFNPSTHLQINNKLLGTLREEILQKCHSIPLSHLATPPNILKMIEQKSQHNSQSAKKLRKQQIRSLMFSINNKFFLQLINSDIPLKQLNFQTIKTSHYANEFQELYQYYEQKVQQLLIDKELTVVAMYVLGGEFFTFENYFSSSLTKKHFPLAQKKYVYSFFQFIQQRKNKFWPYQNLSLQSIISLIDIFFDRTEYKLSFYFDERSQSVQKMEIKPFARFADHMIGKGFTQMLMQTDNHTKINDFPLKGTIFDILINSSPEMKNYYKIPSVNCNRSSKVTLQDLIETMSQVGFKMSEISSILRNFSLIMNIFLLEVQEKQDKINQFSTFQMALTPNIGYKNIRSLYSSQLLLIQSILLNEQANKFELPEQLNSSPTTGIKKQILASILWQLAITRFGNEINCKIQNIGKDLSKTKRFDIYCHYNCSNQEPYSGNFIEEATLQEIEYQIVGRKLVEKEFVIQNKDKDLQEQLLRSKKSQSKKKQKINSSIQFRNQIRSSYLLSLDKSFTSFNSQLINVRKMSFHLYNLMKSMQEIRRMGEEVFHVTDVSDTSEKYWKEFFESSYIQQDEIIVENNYFMCGDFQHFINQEKQGKGLLNFFGKIIEESLQQGKRKNKQFQSLKNSQNNDQTLLSQEQSNKTFTLSSSHNQITNKVFPLANPCVKTPRQSQKKKILFIETENLCEVPGPSSMMKTPQRLSFSIQLSYLVTEYLYGEELKEMHRILRQISKQFVNQVTPYNSSKIYQIVQETIIEISQFRDGPLQGKKHQRILDGQLNNDQLNRLLQLSCFQIFYDVYKQNYYIETSQNLFFKIQRQTNLQKQAVHKIISLFRTYKFRKNHRIFMFRKQFLKRIHKLCKLVILAKTISQVLTTKHLTLVKTSYFKLKLKFSAEKVIKCTQKINKGLNKDLLNSSFEKIKNQSQVLFSSKKINKQEKIPLQQQKQVVNQLKPSQYSLTVTSPSGRIKNIGEKSHQKYVTSIIHSQSMTASNGEYLVDKNNNKKTVLNEIQSQDEKEKTFLKKEKVQIVEISKQQGQKESSKIKDQFLEQQKIKQISPQSINSQAASQEKIIQSTKITQDPIKKPQILSHSPLLQKIHEQLPKVQQKKQESNGLSKSKVSELSNDIVSVLNGGMSGSFVSCRSQNSQKLTKMELFTLKDSPFFSFESWSKQTKTVHPEGSGNKPNPVLFRKLQSQKIKPNELTQSEISQDTVLKQKIMSGSFVGYLKQRLNKGEKQNVQQICLYQKKSIEKPLLKDYSIQKHGLFYKDTFNHILKLSLFKNTSKKLFQLLNLLMKPIRDAYRQQKSTQQMVFEDEPLMINSYESVYNLYRDEMFLQFAKQLMRNKDEDSLNSITFVLEIITKNYYPSPKFFYPFLNFIKTNQLVKPQLYSRIYENLIKFAQAIEGYKGLHVRLHKQQPYVLTQVQYHQYLEPRQSLFMAQECKFMANKITVSLFNGEKYEFIIRNQNLKSIKKKMLFELGFEKYQNNFAFYEERGQNNYYILTEKEKAIDYLARTNSNQPKLILRVRQYYPIKFTDINSLRMFYLNQISDQCRFPFKPQDYEHIVVLGISFDEFEQTRIGNFMLLKKQKLGDEDLKGIKSKLQQYAQTEGDKRICQFEYFKAIKQFNMLLAKSYKIPKQKERYLQQIDRIIVKPKQICFYSSTVMKSSLSLYRIKSFYFQNEEIHIELIYSDRDLGDGHDKKFHGTVKSLTIKGFAKMAELYEDIVYYTELLQLGKTK